MSLPLFFLSGVEGRLLRPRGFAYVVSLFASLIVALTVTPALCSFLLPRSRTVRRGVEPIVVRGLKAGYEPILSATMTRWRPVALLCIAGLVLAGLALGRAGRAFLPDFNEGVSDLATAVRRGAMERLAPIVMTALAAGLALVPLALSGGEPGSEIQTPMAIVILFGLLSSTVLNMIVVPALYLRFGAVKQRLKAVAAGAPAPEPSGASSAAS